MVPGMASKWSHDEIVEPYRQQIRLLAKENKWLRARVEELLGRVDGSGIIEAVGKVVNPVIEQGKVDATQVDPDSLPNYLYPDHEWDTTMAPSSTFPREGEWTTPEQVTSPVGTAEG